MNQNRFTITTTERSIEVETNLSAIDYQKADTGGICILSRTHSGGIHTRSTPTVQSDIYLLLALDNDEVASFDRIHCSFNNRSIGWQNFAAKYPDLAHLAQELMAGRGTPEMAKRLEDIANRRWEEKIGKPDTELTQERVLQLENFRLQIGTRLFKLNEIGEDPEGTKLVEEVRKELQGELDGNLQKLRDVLTSERAEQEAQKEKLEEQVRNNYPPPTLTDITIANQISLWNMEETTLNELGLYIHNDLPVYLLPFNYAPEKVRIKRYDDAGEDFIEEAEIGKTQQKQLQQDTLLLVYPTDDRKFIAGWILLYPDRIKRFEHFHSTNGYDCIGDTASVVRDMRFTLTNALQASKKIARALRIIDLNGLANHSPYGMPEEFYQRDSLDIECFHPKNVRKLSENGGWEI